MLKRSPRPAGDIWKSAAGPLSLRPVHAHAQHLKSNASSRSLHSDAALDAMVSWKKPLPPLQQMHPPDAATVHKLDSDPPFKSVSPLSCRAGAVWGACPSPRQTYCKRHCSPRALRSESQLRLGMDSSIAVSPNEQHAQINTSAVPPWRRRIGPPDKQLSFSLDEGRWRPSPREVQTVRLASFSRPPSPPRGRTAEATRAAIWSEYSAAMAADESTADERLLPPLSPPQLKAK
jgi:hypothetical protein